MGENLSIEVIFIIQSNGSYILAQNDSTLVVNVKNFLIFIYWYNSTYIWVQSGTGYQALTAARISTSYHSYHTPRTTALCNRVETLKLCAPVGNGAVAVLSQHLPLWYRIRLLKSLPVYAAAKTMWRDFFLLFFCFSGFGRLESEDIIMIIYLSSKYCCCCRSFAVHTRGLARARLRQTLSWELVAAIALHRMDANRTTAVWWYSHARRCSLFLDELFRVLFQKDSRLDFLLWLLYHDNNLDFNVEIRTTHESFEFWVRVCIYVRWFEPNALREVSDVWPSVHAARGTPTRIRYETELDLRGPTVVLEQRVTGLGRQWKCLRFRIKFSVPVSKCRKQDVSFRPFFIFSFFFVDW